MHHLAGLIDYGDGLHYRHFGGVSGGMSLDFGGVVLCSAIV